MSFCQSVWCIAELIIKRLNPMCTEIGITPGGPDGTFNRYTFESYEKDSPPHEM